MIAEVVKASNGKYLIKIKDDLLAPTIDAFEVSEIFYEEELAKRFVWRLRHLIPKIEKEVRQNEKAMGN